MPRSGYRVSVTCNIGVGVTIKVHLVCFYIWEVILQLSQLSLGYLWLQFGRLRVKGDYNGIYIIYIYIYQFESHLATFNSVLDKQKIVFKTHFYIYQLKTIALLQKICVVLKLKKKFFLIKLIKMLYLIPSILLFNCPRKAGGFFMWGLKNVAPLKECPFYGFIEGIEERRD